MIDLLTLVSQAASVVVPIAGVQFGLHRQRVAAWQKVDAKIEKLDVDLDGLTEQLRQSTLRAEERYVTKADHGDDIRQLNETCKTLNTSIGDLVQQLFAMARK